MTQHGSLSPLGKLENFLNFVASFFILGLILLAVVQVVGRTVFNMPVPGFIDFAEQAMVTFAFLGIAYCQREGGHMRMELVVGALQDRKLWLTEFVTTMLALILSACLLLGSWLHFKRAYVLGDTTIDIGLPTWPAKLVVPVSIAVLTLRLALQAYRYGRLVLDPAGPQTGIPAMHTPAEQARREAEEAGLDLDSPAQDTPAQGDTK